MVPLLQRMMSLSPFDTPTRTQGGPRGRRGQRGQRRRPPNGAGSSSRGGQKRAFYTQLCLNVLNHCEEEHQGDRHQSNFI